MSFNLCFLITCSFFRLAVAEALDVPSTPSLDLPMPLRTHAFLWQPPDFAPEHPCFYYSLLFSPPALSGESSVGDGLEALAGGRRGEREVKGEKRAG